MKPLIHRLIALMSMFADWIADSLSAVVDGLADNDAANLDGYAGYPEFERAVQWDTYSCGARSVYSVLKHFGKSVSYAAVKSALGTDEDGTAEAPMIRYLRARGLRVGVQPRMTLAKLEEALGRGCVVLVYLDGDHVGVVYGIDREHVYLADPSAVRAWGKKVLRSTFRERWDRYGLTVRPK